MEETDFEEQLRQEAIEKAKKENSGTYTDADGTVFEWVPEKKAWFPKLDEDFIAKYQMNYGQDSSSNKDEDEEGKRKEYEKYCKDYYDYYSSYYNQQGGEGREGGAEKKEGEEDEMAGNSSKDGKSEYTYEDYMAYCNYYYGYNPSEDKNEEKSTEDADKEDKEASAEENENNKTSPSDTTKSKPGEKRKPQEGWFEHDSESTPHVYVSGLPLDITDEEYQELMNKCGLIMFDPRSRKPKLKLYKDEKGEPKGDGLCCYIKQESVELALNILDGSELRGHKISVERAQFQMKGNYDPSKKRRKMSNKEKRKFKEKQAKLFDWRPEKPLGRLKCEQTVVLKNMFDPKDFEEEPALINELRDDVRAEAEKFGEVKKVIVYDRNLDGVVTVKYKEAEEADQCIAALHGRWFAKRRLLAQAWDGKTRYEVQETEKEREARLKKWENFISKSESESVSQDKPSTAETLSSDSAASDSAGALDPSLTSTSSTSVVAGALDPSLTSTSSTSVVAGALDPSLTSTSSTSVVAGALDPSLTSTSSTSVVAQDEQDAQGVDVISDEKKEETNS